MKKDYHIRDLEEISGIKAHTIRMWEKRYNLILPNRSDTNIRSYSESEFKKFLLISQLYHNGFKISEIAKLSKKELQRKALFLNKTTEEQESWISELLNSIIDYEYKIFEKIIQNLIFSFNLTRTITYFLFPFLHKIDVLWKGDTLSYLHRQFAFESTCKFLYSVTYAVEKHTLIAPKKILLFTDNDEINKLKTLYTSIIFKKYNYDTILLTGIENYFEIFDNIDKFNAKSVLTTYPVTKTQQEILIKIIKKLSKYRFYLLDTNYLIDIELPNLMIINSIDEIEDEIII